MIRISISLLMLGLVIQSCDLLKPRTTSSASSSKQKGIDQTTLSPVEYSTSDRNFDYVSKFNRAALLEMERIGVPASITLAQGILESAAGTSELAQQANNHFGIKCSGAWNGKTFYKQDDDRGSDGNLKESCFRKYENVEESFLDHGEFLRDPRKATRYGYLFNMDRTDYKGWARGLQSAGYATNPDYANLLIDLIERYKLYEYDVPGAKPSPTFPATPGAGENGGVKPEGPNAPGTPASASGRIGRVNDVKVVASRDGETLEDIARAYRLNTQKVVDYNDRGYPPGVKLKPNTRIFIQCKKDQWTGRATEHTVRENQTMFEIAQVYGIKMERLLARNGLVRGQEPEVNEKVRLRRSSGPVKPIKLRDTSNEPAQVVVPDKTPEKPKPESMVNDEALDFEIEPAEIKPTTNPTTKPGQTATRPPATSDVPFPGDPRTSSSDPVPARPTEIAEEAPVAPGYHRVVKGDTLYKLSRDFGTSVARIKQLNKLTSDDIKIGQVLRVE